MTYGVLPLYWQAFERRSVLLMNTSLFKRIQDFLEDIIFAFFIQINTQNMKCQTATKVQKRVEGIINPPHKNLA